MTRRDWLIRVFGATVAAAVAPLVDLTDATPGFWNQEPLKKLLPWRVTFPDGGTFSFDGVVVAEKLLDGGGVSFTVRPSGQMKITEGAVPPQDDGELSPAWVDTPALPATPTTAQMGDGPIMELQDIIPPEFSPSFDENLDSYVLGTLRRERTFTMTVKIP